MRICYRVCVCVRACARACESLLSACFSCESHRVRWRSCRRRTSTCRSGSTRSSRRATPRSSSSRPPARPYAPEATVRDVGGARRPGHARWPCVRRTTMTARVRVTVWAMNRDVSALEHDASTPPRGRVRRTTTKLCAGARRTPRPAAACDEPWRLRTGARRRARSPRAAVCACDGP